MRCSESTPPGVALADLAPLFIAALGIALLIFSEGVLLGRSLAERHGYAIDPDRELLAFGAANLGAATLLGFPVGSSQTRSLLNEGSGGRSRAVGLLAALFLVLIVWLLAGPIAKVPVVAIAAILVFTAIGFVDLRCYARLWRVQRYSAVVALATTLGVLALGVLQGILLGVILSLLGALAQVVRPQDALLGRVEGSETLHDVGDDESAHTVPGLV
ncbi:MAG: SulP family inorganic anion transporter, partial [Gammaproteobacteria bacterium]